MDDVVSEEVQVAEHSLRCFQPRETDRIPYLRFAQRRLALKEGEEEEYVGDCETDIFLLVDCDDFVHGHQDRDLQTLLFLLFENAQDGGSGVREQDHHGDCIYHYGQGVKTIRDGIGQQLMLGTAFAEIDCWVIGLVVIEDVADLRSEARGELVMQEIYHSIHGDLSINYLLPR